MPRTLTWRLTEADGLEPGIYARPVWGDSSNTFELLMYNNKAWFYLSEDTLGWVQVHKDYNPAENGTPLVRLKDSPEPPQRLQPVRLPGERKVDAGLMTRRLP